jgi:threonine synthase
VKHAIDEVIYQCEQCGGLLDVEHDVDALKQRSAIEWKELFEQRAAVRSGPYASGVWAKKEWVCSQLPLEDIVTFYEGNTPLLNVPTLGKQIGLSDLWVKLCGNSTLVHSKTWA